MLEWPRGPLGPDFPLKRPGTGPLALLSRGGEAGATEAELLAPWVDGIPTGPALEALSHRELRALARRPGLFAPRVMPGRDRLLLLQGLLLKGEHDAEAVARVMGEGIMAPELGLAPTPEVLLSWLEHAGIPHDMAVKACVAGILALPAGQGVGLAPGAKAYVAILAEAWQGGEVKALAALGRVGRALGQASADQGHWALVPKLAQLCASLPKALQLGLLAGVLHGAWEAGMPTASLEKVAEAFEPLLPEALPTPWADAFREHGAVAEGSGQLPHQGAERSRTA